MLLKSIWNTQHIFNMWLYKYLLERAVESQLTYSDLVGLGSL